MTKTFSDHYEEWYKTYRTQKLRKVSKQSYRVVLNHIKNDPIGRIELNKIKRQDIQGFLNRHGKTRRRITVLDTKRYINACFVDAVHDGLLKANPCARTEVVSVEDSWDVGTLKKVREKKKWLELDEYKKTKMYLISLLNIAFNKDGLGRIIIKNKNGSVINEMVPRLYPSQMLLMTIYIALKTGARFSEILGLTKSDIDFDRSTLNIDKTWDYKFGEGFIPTKTISSIRTIKIDNEFLIVMKNYLKWIKRFNIELEKDALLIRNKKRVHNSTINNVLRSIFKALEIEPITLHKLRHTHASILIAQGVSMQAVAKRLGHNDTNMVQTTYGHLLESIEKAENDKILELI